MPKPTPPYNLDTLSYKSLFKIYQVLENIKIKSEIKNSDKCIPLGNVEKLESGLPTDDHRTIINHLLRIDFICESYPTLASPTLSIDIRQEEFNKFYNQVIAKLKKLKVLEEKKDRDIGAKPQEKWEDIQIKFLNQFDVEITTKKDFYSSDCEKLGFSKTNTKVLTPVASWGFLRLIASQNGVYELDRITGKDKEQTIKSKQDLTKRLKNYFQIDDDPFNEYDSIKKQYKIKIKLIPEQIFREQWEDKDITDYVEQNRDKYKDLEKKATAREVEEKNQGKKEYLTGF